MARVVYVDVVGGASLKLTLKKDVPARKVWASLGKRVDAATHVLETRAGAVLGRDDLVLASAPGAGDALLVCRPRPAPTIAPPVAADDAAGQATIREALRRSLARPDDAAARAAAAAAAASNAWAPPATCDAAKISLLAAAAPGARTLRGPAAWAGVERADSDGGARAALAAHRPVAWPWGAPWGDVAYLDGQLGDGLHIVLESPRVRGAFIHYQDSPADGRENRSYHAFNTRELKLTWAEFRDRAAQAKSSPYRCYLQSLLCAPGKATATKTSARLPQMNWRAAGPDLVRRVAAAGPRLDRLCAAGRLGPLNVSNLFVSDAGAHSPLHYDEYDNVFLQLAGRKRLTLAPPGAPAKPWPTHHPLDAYARARLDRGRTRVIQRRFNVSVPRARVLKKGSTLRDRSER